MSGGHSGVAPPESIPNSAVKHTSADGSVGSPHARVGHRQTSNKRAPADFGWGFFYARLLGGTPITPDTIALGYFIRINRRSHPIYN